MAPAVRGNTLWMLSTGTLTAQDITTLSSPATLWSFAGDGQLVTAPIVLSTPHGDFVIEGSASGMLYALNASTGAIVWSTNVGAGIWPPDEQNVSQPLTGLGAGQGLLVVPAGRTVSAFFRVEDRTAPIITVPGTITAQATSPQGAIVIYSVSATDPDDAASTPLCAPASGSLFPIGTTQVSCVSTDTNANSASATFVTHVEGAEEELADLLLAVNQARATTLASKARQIEAYVAGNKQRKACSAVTSFIGTVKGRGGRGLTAAQAADFSARAANIEHVLGC